MCEQKKDSEVPLKADGTYDSSRPKKSYSKAERKVFLDKLTSELERIGVKENKFEDFYAELKSLSEAGDLDPLVENFERGKSSALLLQFFYWHLLPKTSYSDQHEKFMLKLIEEDVAHFDYVDRESLDDLKNDKDFQRKAIKANPNCLEELLLTHGLADFEVLLDAIETYLVDIQPDTPIRNKSNLEIVTSSMAANIWLFCSEFFLVSAEVCNKHGYNYSASRAGMLLNHNKKERKEYALQLIGRRMYPPKSDSDLSRGERLIEDLKNHSWRIKSLALQIKKAVKEKRANWFDSRRKEKQGRARENEQVFAYGYDGTL